ncbi:MAG TPA: hypothetical protein PKW29_05090 [Clostridia bacterium]|nr:hypothetical protein [Clostridia bacterium]
MKRRWLRFCAGALGLTLFLISACAKKDYAEAIKGNWGIELPEGCQAIYVKQSEAGFNGDSERYHVFDCSDAQGMPELVEWYDGIVKDNASYRLLDVLGVEDADYPQPGIYKKYVQSKAGGSTLVLLYSLDSKLLYVLEDFY